MRLPRHNKMHLFPPRSVMRSHRLGVCRTWQPHQFFSRDGRSFSAVLRPFNALQLWTSEWMHIFITSEGEMSTSAQQCPPRPRALSPPESQHRLGWKRPPRSSSPANPRLKNQPSAPRGAPALLPLSSTTGTEGLSLTHVSERSVGSVEKGGGEKRKKKEYSLG